MSICPLKHRAETWFYRTTWGNRNWLKKSEVQEIKGKLLLAFLPREQKTKRPEKLRA